MNIMNEIIEARRARIRKVGHEFGHEVPRLRGTPVVPFARSRPVSAGRGATLPEAAALPAGGRGASPAAGATSAGAAAPSRGAQPAQEGFLICEIKRRSPSKGAIEEGLDAVAQAGLYAARGVATVSVLTEEERFGGSLRDLIDIKRAHPSLSVLRKDFLIDPEDVDVSYRAGADAILLLAAALPAERLAALYQRAAQLGMSCLVEVHSKEEVERIASLRPAYTGINARDLASFAVDPIVPIATKRFITWPTRLVFESGISAMEHAAFARASGFDGILVGESVVRDPSLIPGLFDGLSTPRAGFWERLYARRPGPGGGAPASAPAAPATRRRPLVKICGLRRVEDARLADELGADILGFIFAPSKRQADAELVRAVGRTKALKVGVVVLERGKTALAGPVRALLEGGQLDAIQLHGDEAPEDCFSIAFPYYKALQLRNENEMERLGAYRCPRVLIDAFSAAARGGTGTEVEASLARAVAQRLPLWLAGGIGPDNVRTIVTELRPELIDASSRLEAEIGRKDPSKLRAFFREIAAACEE